MGTNGPAVGMLSMPGLYIYVIGLATSAHRKDGTCLQAVSAAALCALLATQGHSQLMSSALGRQDSVLKDVQTTLSQTRDPAVSTG